VVLQVEKGVNLGGQEPWVQLRRYLNSLLQGTSVGKGRKEAVHEVQNEGASEGGNSSGVNAGVDEEADVHSSPLAQPPAHPLEPMATLIGKYVTTSDHSTGCLVFFIAPEPVALVLRSIWEVGCQPIALSSHFVCFLLLVLLTTFVLRR